jgi:uncharacterized protein (DUF3084 family)
VRTSIRRYGPPTAASAATATSIITGLAGHWFAAWTLLLVLLAVMMLCFTGTDNRRQRALIAARTELAGIKELHRTVRAEIHEARNETRAAQQEARADLELMRAELTVATDPDEPDGRPGPGG